jgi:hypothetical protein
MSRTPSSPSFGGIFAGERPILPMIDLTLTKQDAIPWDFWGMLYEDWKPTPADGVTVFLKGLENRGPDNLRKRIYFSSVSPTSTRRNIRPRSSTSSTSFSTLAMTRILRITAARATFSDELLVWEAVVEVAQRTAATRRGAAAHDKDREGDIFTGGNGDFLDVECLRAFMIQEEQVPWFRVRIEPARLERRGNVEHYDGVLMMGQNGRKIVTADRDRPCLDQGLDLVLRASDLLCHGGHADYLPLSD